MRRGAWLPVGLLAGMALAQAPDYGFMPDGGRPAALRLVAADPATLAVRDDLAAWSARVAAAEPGLSQKETSTLAAYLAVAIPAAGGDPAALPSDGRDLALANCQSCHSLFTGYLTQRRDEAGWLAIFKAPFHSGIAMTGPERAIFAAYSALNMPVPVADVPPELRF